MTLDLFEPSTDYPKQVKKLLHEEAHAIVLATGYKPLLPVMWGADGRRIQLAYQDDKQLMLDYPAERLLESLTQCLVATRSNSSDSRAIMRWARSRIQSAWTKTPISKNSANKSEDRSLEDVYSSCMSSAGLDSSIDALHYSNTKLKRLLLRKDTIPPIPISVSHGLLPSLVMRGFGAGAQVKDISDRPLTSILNTHSAGVTGAVYEMGRFFPGRRVDGIAGFFDDTSEMFIPMLLQGLKE